MPYKSEKIKLPPTKDRRRKLTDEQKEEIKKPLCNRTCWTKTFSKTVWCEQKFNSSHRQSRDCREKEAAYQGTLERLQTKQGRMGKNNKRA